MSLLLPPQVLLQILVLSGPWVAYALFASVVIYMKAVLYVLDARKLWRAKTHLDIMHHAIWPYGCTVFCFIRSYAAFIMFSMFSIDNSFGSSDIPHVC